MGNNTLRNLFSINTLLKILSFVLVIPKAIATLLFTLLLLIIKVIKKIFDTIIDIINNKAAFLNASLSALIPGMGQLRNKQKYKFYIFFGVFLVFLSIEIVTGNYFQGISDLITNRYPSQNGISFFRDYGGMFLKGIWGFVTLGKYVMWDSYRGYTLDNVLWKGNPSWAVADNSQVLLGNGAIAIVFSSIYIGVYLTNIKDAYTSRKKLLNNEPLATFKQFKKTFFDDFFAIILMTPAIILIGLFVLVPFLFSFSIAFTDFKNPIGVETSEKLINWVGFDNFIRVLTDNSLKEYFIDVSAWTVFYALMASVTVFVIGMFSALIIESNFVKYKRIFRIIMIIPWAIPALVTLMAFRSVFGVDGLADTILQESGLLEPVKRLLTNIGLIGQPMTDLDGNITPISWLTGVANGRLAKLLVITVNLWLGWPYFMMLVTGILGTVPKSLYEAADMDGATDFQKFRYITFPWIMKASIPVIISTFTFNFNNFGAIYFLTSGGPKYPDALSSFAPGQTDILISWIYKMSFETKLYNIAAVYSILIFIFIATFALWNLSRVKSFWEED